MYQEKDGEVRLQGLPVSPGLAVSRVCLFNDRRHDRLNVASAADPPRELAALDDAVATALNQLASLSRDVAERIGPAEAGIFSAQAMILEDAALLEKIRAAIRKGLSASRAITLVLDEYEARLLALDNEYIRDRASDIGEIKRRLLDVLGDVRPSLKCAGQAHCRKGYDRIIVAEELTPSLTLELDARHVRAFVTERGGQTSHAAILARALGIPAVTGLRGIHQAVTCGTELLVDGQTGEVVVWPATATLGAVRAAAPVAQVAEPPVPALRVQANITTAADTAAALEARAEGVGLYRTEFEFFAANRLLNEDEQFDLYLSVLQAMPGETVTFRLLDVGGDKSAGFFEIEQEQNPYLGLRGSRLLMARSRLWRDQARALARVAAQGRVQVMYPMIVDVDQFLTLRGMFAEAVADLPPAPLAHGVMLEVPSACLQVRELLAQADFASVGTNDLIQYLFAVDRNNEQVSYDYRPDREVLWRLIAEMCSVAREMRRPLTVCGELAAETRHLPRLLEAGVTAVSVSPRMIAGVRAAVRQKLSG